MTMKPIKFPDMNCTYAENQPKYQPLPAHKTKDGEVISCWSFSWKERIQLLCTGRIWLSILTFNHPLQPQLPYINNPFRMGAYKQTEEANDD